MVRRAAFSIRALTALLLGAAVLGSALFLAHDRAQSVPDIVEEQFDPTTVRSLRLVMEPLAGYEPPAGFYPADWNDTTVDPVTGVSVPVWTDEEKAAWLALPQQQVEIDRLARAAAWDVIRTDATNTIRLAAQFHADGAPEDGLRVGVRRKSSRALPSEADPQKVGLKVGFSDLVKGQTWKGVSRLSLENGGDISPLYEGIAWRLHQMAQGTGLYPAGYDPGLAAWTTLQVNGANLGVYTSVEQRNKQFMRNRGLWADGASWLYKQDDIGLPEFEEGPTTLDDTGTPVPVHSPTYDLLCYSPFQRASTACPTPDDATLARTLPAQVDMDVLLTEAAVDAFSANNDAMVSKGKNAYFIDRTVVGPDGAPQSEPRRYYPWDLDAVFGGSATSGQLYALATTTNKRGQVTGYTQSEYQRVILNHPDFRSQFNRKVLTLLDGPLATARIHELIDAVYPALAPALRNDPYGTAVTGSDIDGHFANLKAWVSARDPYVRQQVAANKPVPRPAYPGAVDGESPVVTAPVLSPATAEAGASVTVTASATDNAGVASGEVTLDGGATWQALSFADGVSGGVAEALTRSIVAPAAGTHAVCVRATDAAANVSPQACTTFITTAARTATGLAWSGATSTRVSAAFSLQATLTTTTGPVAGATVTFEFNRARYTVTTNAAGVALQAVKAPSKTGSYVASASFPGSAAYLPSTTAVTVVVTK